MGFCRFNLGAFSFVAEKVSFRFEIDIHLLWHAFRVKRLVAGAGSLSIFQPGHAVPVLQKGALIAILQAIPVA